MATAQKQTQTKTAKKPRKATKKTETTKTPMQVVKMPLIAANDLPKGVHLVTSMNLLRKEVIDGNKTTFFLDDEQTRYLHVLGLQMGVTWCEILRGLINQSIASNDPVSGLIHFVPALQP